MADVPGEVLAGLTEHREAVRRFVLRLVGDPALAEDLTQEAFLRAVQRLETFRGEASARSWLFAIALNLCRDHFRAKAHVPPSSRHPEQVDRLPGRDDVEGETLRAEMSACIGGYVLRLPERQRQAVALHDLGGLDHDQTAALLGMSPGAFRVLLHRGRRALRELLETHCVVSLGDAIPCEPREDPGHPPGGGAPPLVRLRTEGGAAAPDARPPGGASRRRLG